MHSSGAAYGSLALLTRLRPTPQLLQSIGQNVIRASSVVGGAPTVEPLADRARDRTSSISSGTDSSSVADALGIRNLLTMYIVY